MSKPNQTGTMHSPFSHILITTLLILATALLVACGVTPATPTPEPAASPTVEATAATPAQATTETDTPDADASTPTPAVEEEDEAEETAATTPIPTNGAAVLTPLVVDDTPAECELESNLDLAGYLDIEERMGCAQDLAKFDPVAINEFGEGPDYSRFMLWIGAEGNIYVLRPDGTYTVHLDEWQEGDPTFTCNPLDIEADSPPLPRRGFGKIWCEEPELQETMGLVEREERLCQHAVEQPFELGRLIACFEDASVRYFRILNDGTWDVTLQ